MSRLSVIVLGIASLMVSGCDREPPAPSQQDETVGEAGAIDRSRAGTQVPEVTLVHSDGRTLALREPDGRPMLLNLWATWCAPCIKEMPLLDTLAADYAGELDVVTASQDLQAEKVAEFFAENDLPNLEQWHDEETQLSFTIGAGLPITVLYDAEGREVWRVVGDADWGRADIREAIDAVL